MATANFDAPVDLLGNRLSIDDVKQMICRDVVELAAAHELLRLDSAKRRELGSPGRNRRLLNLVEMWETAHDVHWAWYNMMRADASTECA